jgi:hypothetical protein
MNGAPDAIVTMDDGKIEMRTIWNAVSSERRYHSFLNEGHLQ